VEEEFKPFSFVNVGGKARSFLNWKHVYTLTVALHFTLPSTLIKKRNEKNYSTIFNFDCNALRIILQCTYSNNTILYKNISHIHKTTGDCPLRNEKRNIT
jgi:hypothetical protein